MNAKEAQPTKVSSPMQLMQLLWPGAVAVQAIHVAAKLALADLLADSPKTAAELADATRTDAASLDRFLRALTSLGIFANDPSGRYCQTDLSEALRANHSQSMRPWAMMLGAQFIWEPIGFLDESIRTGRAAFEHVYRAPFFNHLSGARGNAGSSLVLEDTKSGSSRESTPHLSFERMGDRRRRP